MVAFALLPVAPIGGFSLAGSIRVRNTTVSCVSANTYAVPSRPSRTRTHSLLIDFLTSRFFVCNYSAQLDMMVKHKDTEAQRHKERRHRMTFCSPAFFVPLCLCVFVFNNN